MHTHYSSVVYLCRGTCPCTRAATCATSCRATTGGGRVALLLATAIGYRVGVSFAVGCCGR